MITDILVSYGKRLARACSEELLFSEGGCSQRMLARLLQGDISPARECLVMSTGEGQMTSPEKTEIHAAEKVN